VVAEVRALISFPVVAVAVILQLTVMDRIAFPGGTGPDLVLLAVAALALANGPLIGALLGFWAGLAMDVAPPGSHFVGQNALVFCLVGYACGLLADKPSGDGVPEQGHTALFEIAVTAMGAVCGEILAALLGAMLSDPRVTWPAIRHVLPVAIAYDLLLSPFVLYAVAAPLRLAGTRGSHSRAAWSALGAQSPVPGAAQGAVRQVSTANPRLRLSDHGKGDGWVRGQGTGRPTAKREPRFNLGRSGSLGGAALGAAFATGGSRRGSGLAGGLGASRSLSGPASLRGLGGPGSALGGGSAKVRFGTQRHAGVLGGSLLGGSLFAGSASGSAALRSSSFGRSRMGRSLLGGSVFSSSSSALNRPAPARRSASLARSSFLGRSPFLGRPSLFARTSWLSWPFSAGRSGGLKRSAAGGLTGRAPRFGSGSSLGRLAGALRRSVRPRSTVHKSPGRGWTRRTSSRGGTMGRGAVGRRTMGRGAFSRGASGRSAVGRGWTGGSTPRRTGRSARLGPTRLHMPRPRAKRKWRTGGYR
jgi:rod shape-determining protein MreD